MSIKRILGPLAAAALAAAPALAAETEAHVEDISFSFEGPFGTYAALQLQRGFQVFHQVCAACHGQHKQRQEQDRRLTDEDGWPLDPRYTSTR